MTFIFAPNLCQQRTWIFVFAWLQKSKLLSAFIVHNVGQLLSSLKDGNLLGQRFRVQII